MKITSIEGIHATAELTTIDDSSTVAIRIIFKAHIQGDQHRKMSVDVKDKRALLETAQVIYRWLELPTIPKGIIMPHPLDYPQEEVINIMDRIQLHSTQTIGY